MTSTHIVLLSGGLDSTTCLALATEMADSDTRVRALSVNYGQRHRDAELAAARAVAEHYAVPHDVLDLSSWGRLIPGSALTDAAVPVPTADYDADTMATTVVPNRNAVLLMAAAGIADAHGGGLVYTAVHGGDHHLYPDCRPEFMGAAHRTAQAATEGRVGLEAPFIRFSKADIVGVGHNLRAPLHLTWSCYEGGEEHCGTCGTCRERRDAFTTAGVPDPTTYRQEARP